MNSEHFEYGYIDGWKVTAELRENSQEQNPPVDVCCVTIQVEELVDPDNDRDLLRYTSHSIEYIRLPGHTVFTFGGTIWENVGPQIQFPISVGECVYDALARFTLHELQHFLTDPDGEFVIDPHPEREKTV